ncbi:MAG: PGF-pre-PGF domain-containing protein [Candidatus Woesearchaeota archaeon]
MQKRGLLWLLAVVTAMILLSICVYSVVDKLIYPSDNYDAKNPMGLATASFNVSTRFNNCTLWSNFAGSWRTNDTIKNITAGGNLSAGNYVIPMGFDLPLGAYKWNVNCTTNGTKSWWINATNNYTINVNNPIQPMQPADKANISGPSVPYVFKFNQFRTTPMNWNCTLYTNFSNEWRANETGINLTGLRNITVTANLAPGTYKWKIKCFNPKWTIWSAENWTFNRQQDMQPFFMKLNGPPIGTQFTSALVNLSYQVTRNSNCSLLTNFSGIWNATATLNVTPGTQRFSVSPRNGAYKWNVNCTNGTNTLLGNITKNWTFIMNKNCEDLDGDGFNSSGKFGCGKKDCDETNPAIKPLVAHNCGNGKDNDCDWLVDSYEDACGAAKPNWAMMDFSKPPYAANGPGCYNGAAPNVVQGTMPGENCPGASLAYDMGGVWVDQDQDFVYWQVLAPDISNAKFCGGNKNLRIFVEFDADNNQSTGCTNCFPGSDYQFIVNLDGFGEMWQYDAVAPTCLGGSGYCFTYNKSIPVYVNISKTGATCNTQPSTMTIAVKKSTIIPITGMNFETNSFTENNANEGGGPNDMLRGGAGNDPFMGAGPKEGGMNCFQFDNSEQNCNNGTDDFACKYNTQFHRCEPDFAQFNDCSNACFSCQNETACNTSATGICQWTTNPKGSPPKICVESFNPFEGGGGGDCSNDCYACFADLQCNYSKANGGSTGYGGCQWFTDPFSGKGFCEVKGFKVPSCTAQDWNGCTSKQSCESDGWNWSLSYYLCNKNSTYEICFDGIDNDNDALIDCMDKAECYTVSECGGGIDTLTGGGQFAGQDPFQAMQDFMFQGMDNGPPVMIGTDQPYDTPPDRTYADILGTGVKDGAKSIFFGAMLRNVSTLKLTGQQCNLTGTNALRLIFALDTDQRNDTGCQIRVGQTNYNGLEFIIKMYVNGSITYTAYKCLNETQNQWVISAMRLSAMPDMLCNPPEEDGGPFTEAAPAVVMTQKSDINNPKDTLRVIAVTVNGSWWSNFSRIKAFDQLEAYYTPGSVDFNPVDCFKEPTKCGAAFATMGEGKYMPIEDCMRPGDEDLDGNANCNDSDCSFAPWCQGQYNPLMDKEAPRVSMNTVQEFDMGAFVMWSTNEPTNGSLYFYNTSSTCSGNYITIMEPFQPGFQAEMQFKPWHNVMVDNYQNRLGFNLYQSTTYFYKIRNCDRADPANCGQSKCMNFTTRGSKQNVTLMFNLSNTGNNFVDNMNVSINSQKLTKGNFINFNYTNNVNLTFKGPIPGTPNFWEITFVNADLATATSLKLTDSMLANFTSGKYVVGMANGLWLEIAQKLGAEFIIVRLPADGQDLTKCDDSGENCETITSDTLKLNSGTIGGEQYSYWKIPVTYGFSTYTTSGGVNYTLTFATVWNNLAVSVGLNNTKLINVTNGDNFTRTYNISVVSRGAGMSYRINGSYPRLNNVQFSAYQKRILNLTLWATSAGLSYFDVIAVLSTNATIKLNSSDDLPGGSLILNASEVQGTNITIKLMTPGNGTVAEINTSINLKFNVTSNNIGGLLYVNCSLWSNGYGNFEIMYLWPETLPTNSTLTSSANLTIITDSIGTSLWNVKCESTIDPGDFAFAESNYTFNTTPASDHIAPSVNLISPINGYNSSIASNSLICTAADANLKNVSIYHNIGSTWHANETNSSGVNGSYSIPISFAEGSYKWNCFACDIAGNCTFATINRTLTVDLQSPRINMLNVSTDGDRWVRSTDNINLTANVTDVIAVARVTVNHTALSKVSGRPDIWRIRTNLSALGISGDGTHILTFNASDYSGRSNTSTLTLHIDDSKPQVSLALTNDSILRSYQWAKFNVTVADLNISTVQLNSSINQTAMTRSGQYFSLVPRMSWFCKTNGTCTLNFVATDIVGNKNTTTTLSVIVDERKPRVLAPATSDADSKVKSTDSIILTVNASDIDSSIVSVTGNGTAMSNSVGNTWVSAPVTPTALGCANSGTCTLRFIAIDSAGNINSTTTLALTIDNVPPKFNRKAFNVTSKKIGTNQYLKVWANVSDTNGVRNVTVKYDGNPEYTMSLSNGNYSRITTPAELGITTTSTNHAINITACDNVGNCNMTGLSGLNVTAAKPRVLNFTSNVTYVKSSWYINFTAKVNDTLPLTVLLNYTKSNTMRNITDQIIWRKANTTAALGCSNAENVCSFNIIATDSIGNTNNSVRLNIIIDDLKPRVTNFSIDDADRYVRSYRDNIFIVHVNDANISTVKINGTDLTNIYGDTWLVPLTADFKGCLGNTSCSLYISAVDKLGNTNSTVSMTLAIDDVAPKITIHSLTNHTNISSRLVNFTITDNMAMRNSSIMVTGTGVSNYSIGYCTGNNTKLRCAFNAVMSQGAHNLKINLTDKADNNATATVSFLYDNVAPAISGQYVPTTTVSTAASTIVLKYSINDSTAGMSQAWFKLDGQATKYYLNHSRRNTTITERANLSAGTHSLIIYANDTSKNSNSVSVGAFYVLARVNLTNFTGSMERGDAKEVEIYLENGSLATGQLYFNRTIREVIVANSTTGGVNSTINITVYGTNIAIGNAHKPKLTVNLTSIIASAIAAKVGGAKLNAFVMYQNMSYMINDSNYKNASGHAQWVQVHIQRALGTNYVIFIGDDFGTQVYVLGNCAGNARPTTTPSAANACYTNSSTWTKVWVPHLSGAGLANPNNAPSYSITLPAATITDSKLTFSGMIYDLNLNASSCWYNLSKGALTLTRSGTTPSLSQGTTNYSFSISYAGESWFLNLTNETKYNISISCASLGNGNRSSSRTQFLVNDITIPDVSTTVTAADTAASIALTGESYEAFNYTVGYYLSSTKAITNTSSSSFQTEHTISLTTLSDETTYNYTYKYCDRTGNCNTSKQQFTTEATAVTQTPPSSGGGGGGIAKSLTTISKYWDILRQGQNSMSIASAAYGIKKVVFQVSNNTRKASIQVQRFTGKPTDVAEPSGAVYKYLQITLTNIKEEVLSGIEVQFNVPVEWLTNAKAEDVRLKRYVNGAWVELATQIAATGTKDVSFKAQTPGFSYFVIGLKAEEAAAQQPAAPSNETTPPAATGEATAQPTEETTPVPEAQPVTKPKTKMPGTVLLILAVAAVLALAGYLLFKTRKIPRIEREAKAFVEKARKAGKHDFQIADELRRADWPEEKIRKMLKKK